MSKKFNLLLLHQPSDLHPRSWVCLNGPRLKAIFKDLEKDALENRKWCREKLSRKLANRLNCSHSTIKWVLQGKHVFYPIPIILELLKFSINKEDFLKEFRKNIKYLKINSASAKPVKAVYKLNENLAKILGAFMADGSLSVQIVIAALHLQNLEKIKNKIHKSGIHYSIGIAPSRNQYYISMQANKSNFSLLNQILYLSHSLSQTHYNIELTDEYKYSVEAFAKWIKEEFGINPNRFERRRNAWRVSFSNKILARYLMSFFEVKPGPKAYSAFEPTIIKKSNLKIRKSFARGVLMFDGCVTKERKISFGTVSQTLFNSMKQIWKKDDLKFGESINQRAGGYKPKNKYTFYTLTTMLKNRKEKLLEYFEPNTQKWILINWLHGDMNYNPIIKTNSSFSLEKILKILQKIRICDTYFLKSYFGCRSYSHVRSYLKILRDQGKINLSIYPNSINDYISENTTVLLRSGFHELLFKQIRNKFKKDKNLAEFLGINKATLSAWKVKKNRIPVYILKEMCRILNLNFNEASKNVEKTDREIIEII